MDTQTNAFSLSFLPLLIRLKCCETTILPSFLGSTLHGILGWALAPYPEVYRYMFENRRLGGGKQDIVNPYFINLPRYRSVYSPGDELRFEIVLLGNAVHYSRDFIKAIIQTKQFGLGAERKQFELLEIFQSAQLRAIWQQNFLDINTATPELLLGDTREKASHCTIHLLSPLRIRRGGMPLLEIDFLTIIRNIMRRITEIATRYGGHVNLAEAEKLLEDASQIKTTSSGLYLSQISRYSNRKSEKMDISGLLGAITFEGDISPFIPWLNAAYILHIGRNTTFGCGQIDVSFR